MIQYAFKQALSLSDYRYQNPWEKFVKSTYGKAACLRQVKVWTISVFAYSETRS